MLLSVRSEKALRDFERNADIGDSCWSASLRGESLVHLAEKSKQVVDTDAARRPQSVMSTTHSPVVKASKSKGLVPRGARLSANSLC